MLGLFKYFNTKVFTYINITLELTSSIYIKYKNYDFALNYRSRNSIKNQTHSSSQQNVRYTQYTEREHAHNTRSQSVTRWLG